MQLSSNEQCQYTPDPGVVAEGESVHCGVCGDKMNEIRDCNGPRGFAMAMSGSKSLHDYFSCPNMDDEWHKQVVLLRKEARESNSNAITTILLAEAEQVCCNRKPTKDKVFNRR